MGSADFMQNTDFTMLCNDDALQGSLLGGTRTCLRMEAHYKRRRLTHQLNAKGSTGIRQFVLGKGNVRVPLIRNPPGPKHLGLKSLAFLPEWSVSKIRPDTINLKVTYG